MKPSPSRGRTNGLGGIRRLAPLAGRAGWGLLDQAFSSATNFAVAVIIARSVALQDFGAFSLAFSAYLLAVNLTRAFPMQPVAIRFSEVEPAAWRAASADALGTGLIAGVGGGVAFAGIGLVIGGTLGQAFVALGITLPGLVLQDGWRSVFFAARRGRLAVANDAVWAIVLVPGFLLVLSTGLASVFWLTLAWGGAATVAAVIGVLQAGFIPRPRRAATWWREQRDLGARYLVEAAVSTGSSQGAVYGVGLVAGLAAVGAFRAGLLFFGPLHLLYMGIGLMSVPEGVRALNRSIRHLLGLAIGLSVGLGVTALLWGAVLVAIPEQTGEQILGDNWAAAVGLFVPLTLAYACIVSNGGPLMMLRALANARRSLRASVWAAATSVLIVAGAAGGGSLGAAWGAAAAAALGVVGWWYESRLAAREHAPSPSAGPTAPTSSPPL